MLSHRYRHGVQWRNFDLGTNDCRIHNARVLTQQDRQGQILECDEGLGSDFTHFYCVQGRNKALVPRADFYRDRDRARRPINRLDSMRFKCPTLLRSNLESKHRRSQGLRTKRLFCIVHTVRQKISKDGSLLDVSDRRASPHMHQIWLTFNLLCH